VRWLNRTTIADRQRHILRRRRQCAPDVVLAVAPQAALRERVRLCGKNGGRRVADVDVDETCRVRIVVLPAFGRALGETEDPARNDGDGVCTADREQQVADLAAVARLDDSWIAEVDKRGPVLEELEP